MKKILITILTISSIIIAGCGDNTKFEFGFEEFEGYFITENTFSINNTETKWLAAGLLKNNIIHTYTQIQSSWYIDSIIVIKKPSSQQLDEFVSQNTKKIKMEWYISKSTNNNTFKCNKEKIDMQTIDSDLEWNLSNIFFTQAFFMHKWNAYIISFSSEEEQERDTFASDIKNLKCKSIEE